MLACHASFFYIDIKAWCSLWLAQAILEDSVYEPFALWVVGNPELQKGLSSASLGTMLVEYLKTGEGAELAAQQRDRMSRSSKISQGTRQEISAFMGENKGVIREGRARSTPI